MSYHDKGFKPRPQAPPASLIPQGELWAAFDAVEAESSAFVDHTMECAKCRPMQEFYCLDGQRLRTIYDTALASAMQRIRERLSGERVKK